MSAESRPLSRAEKVELLQLLEEQKRRQAQRLAALQFQSLYDWQLKFVEATASYTSCMLMAANRCVGSHTHVSYKSKTGMDLRSRPILEALSDLGEGVQSLVDGSERTSGKLSAYFQGILPTTRLFLADGAFLDCSDGHQLLDAEGNYSTISQLTSRQGAPCSLQTLVDYLASCGEDDCRYDRLLRPLSDIYQAHIQESADARQRTLVASPEDAAERIGRYILALSDVDLLSIPDALSRCEALCADEAFQVDAPSALLLSGLAQAGKQLPLVSSLVQEAPAAQECSGVGCGEACSNHMVFPSVPVLLYGGKQIIAWRQIGIQPCFDLSVPDANNYLTAGGTVSHNCGKTRTGLTIDAAHLLGDYPADWPGHKFEHAPMCWLLGFSMEKTRDLLQTPMFGRLEGGKWTGGMVPADRIVDHKSATGTSGAMREVRVKHSSGGVATCQFWSYSQGQHAIMGDSVDWYHIDEEPRDKAIFPQVLTRTATGDKGRGGRGILTFTPENGRTELVVQFMDTPSAGQYMQRATWDDAKHLSENTKRDLLAQYPAWQRDMRTKGLPLLGAGLIFDFSDDEVKCQPFECPPHWWVVNGMDFGWDHPQAHVQLWIDRDSDTIYLAQAWKKSRVTPSTVWGAIKSWAQNVPTAWPHDGLQTEKGSGDQQRKAYADAGWLMMPEHATWQVGGNGVEAGLVELYERMESGKFKVFSHLTDWFEEKLNYHRDENGNIVKVNDDLLSATRYAYMMQRYAKQRKDTATVIAGNFHMPRPIQPKRLS